MFSAIFVLLLLSQVVASEKQIGCNELESALLVPFTVSGNLELFQAFQRASFQSLANFTDESDVDDDLNTTAVLAEFRALLRRKPGIAQYSASASGGQLHFSFREHMDNILRNKGITEEDRQIAMDSIDFAFPPTIASSESTWLGLTTRMLHCASLQGIRPSNGTNYNRTYSEDNYHQLHNAESKRNEHHNSSEDEHANPNERIDEHYEDSSNHTSIEHGDLKESNSTDRVNRSTNEHPVANEHINSSLTGKTVERNNTNRNETSANSKHGKSNQTSSANDHGSNNEKGKTDEHARPTEHSRSIQSGSEHGTSSNQHGRRRKRSVDDETNEHSGHGNELAKRTNQTDIENDDDSEIELESAGSECDEHIDEMIGRQIAIASRAALVTSALGCADVSSIASLTVPGLVTQFPWLFRTCMCGESGFDGAASRIVQAVATLVLKHHYKCLSYRTTAEDFIEAGFELKAINRVQELISQTFASNSVKLAVKKTFQTVSKAFCDDDVAKAPFKAIAAFPRCEMGCIFTADKVIQTCGLLGQCRQEKPTNCQCMWAARNCDKIKPRPISCGQCDCVGDGYKNCAQYCSGKFWITGSCGC